MGTGQMRHILSVVCLTEANLRICQLLASQRSEKAKDADENDADAVRVNELQLGVLYKWKTAKLEFPSISELYLCAQKQTSAVLELHIC